jgi:hypothetical protein
MLLPILGAGQVKLGPFTFLKGSKARNLTANLVLGGPSLAGLSAELPALKALSFFDFIPGYANRLFAASDGSNAYAELMVISRARYRPKRKVIALIGLGPSLSVAKKIKPGVSVILGVNYLFHEKYTLTVDIRSAGMLTFGLGWHNGYGWL